MRTIALIPMGVHLRANLLILFGKSLKHARATGDDASLLLSEMDRNVFLRVSPKLRWFWAMKSDRFYVSIHCETPRSYRNTFQQLASTPIRTTAQF